MTAKLAPLALTLALTGVLLAPATTYGRTAGAAPVSLCTPGDTVHTVMPGVYSIEPRHGFDPVVASAPLLACYGFPPRPVDASAREAWTDEMRRFHYVAPQIYVPPAAIATQDAAMVRQVTDAVGAQKGRGSLPRHPAKRALQRLASSSLTSTEANYYWTGYDVLSKYNNYDSFIFAAADFTVPSVQLTDPMGRQIVYAWVGLGGDSQADQASKILWQAGIATLYDPQYNFFFEDYGCAAGQANCPNNGDPVRLQMPSVQQGDQVNVSINQRNGTYFMMNRSTNQGTSLVTVPIQNQTTDLSADWIIEDSNVGRGYAHFGDPNFHGAYSMGHMRRPRRPTGRATLSPSGSTNGTISASTFASTSRARLSRRLSIQARTRSPQALMATTLVARVRRTHIISPRV